MITYAGIPLTPPADGLAELERYWPGHRIEEFEHPFYTGGAGLDHLPLPAAPRSDPPRVGVLHWPTGASRWATCHLLASGEQVAAIRTALGSASVARILRFDDGVHTAVEAEMWMLPPRPISQKGERELYLLTLVDYRYQLWFTTPIANYPWTTWSGLLTGLTGGQVIPPGDLISSSYGIPNRSRWEKSFFKPRPILIDAAASSIGVRMVWNLFGFAIGGYSYFNASPAIAADDARWETYKYEVLSGGRLTVADIARTVPESVSVVFEGDTTEIETINLNTLALAQYSGYSGVSGASATICADMSPLASDADRRAYAIQAARDYYLWALSRTECTIRGLQAVPFTGMESAIEWVHPASGEMVTRIFRLPQADRNQNFAASPRSTFMAVLTTNDAGTPPKWKFRPVTIVDGVETLGTVTTDYCAMAYTVLGSDAYGNPVYANPVNGLRVRVWETGASISGARQYEFSPVGYATNQYPGLVSIESQTFRGFKTFHGTDQSTGLPSASYVSIKANDNGIAGSYAAVRIQGPAGGWEIRDGGSQLTISAGVSGYIEWNETSGWYFTGNNPTITASYIYGGMYVTSGYRVRATNAYDVYRSGAWVTGLSATVNYMDGVTPRTMVFEGGILVSNT